MRFLIYKLFIFLPLFSGHWAEETLKKMAVQEKIGQLIVIPASPHFNREVLFGAMHEWHIGNILVKQGHPLEQIPFLNALQEKSCLPLLCLGDAEWGLGMRMEGALSFPKNGILGRHPQSIPAVGEWIGQQCQIVGIHLNLAPVVDVNNKPKNPIIGIRSFGADPVHVAQCGASMICAMQKGGVLTCAKHFPGHGDTKTDSHHALPVIPHSLEHLQKVEFVPFKEAIAAGVDAIMTGHLFLPALDPHLPATLSHPIVTTLLQKEWGFEGLVITDALNMAALSKTYSPEETAIQALLAGHDLLLYGAHLYNDIEEILIKIIPRVCRALETIPEASLDRHVLKILQTKEKLGLHSSRFTPLSPHLMEELHHPDAVALIETLN